MPTKVIFETSKDGKNFTRLGEIITQTDPKEWDSIVEDYEVNTSEEAQYIRIIAKNTGICPPWHKGAGNKAWIFADEIVINKELQ